jgi:hypothetical protein
LEFLDDLERDWSATQQVLPGRTGRLDGLYDDALAVLIMRAGVGSERARRMVEQTRRTMEGGSR